MAVTIAVIGTLTTNVIPLTVATHELPIYVYLLTSRKYVSYTCTCTIIGMRSGSANNYWIISGYSIWNSGYYN